MAALVAAHLPARPARGVVRLGEGLDNVAYEVDGELVVRLSKEPDRAARAARVDREARLLALVARISPLPVPRVRFTDPGAGCLAYGRLPGRSLLDLPARQRAAYAPRVAAALGGLLAALHGVPAACLDGLVDADDQPAGEWLREAAETYAQVRTRVPAEYRRAVEVFLASAPPADGYTLVFSHNDLGVEHVLVDPSNGTVTGVLDWSDAAMVDPAYDLGLVLRDLGPHALDAALARHAPAVRAGTGLRERALYYARCTLLEDLAHGAATGDTRYVDKSLAALPWLFPVRTG